MWNLRGILEEVYAHTDLDANDWCFITDPKTGKEVYLNKRTGAHQSEKPVEFSDVRINPLEFAFVTVSQ